MKHLILSFLITIIFLSFTVSGQINPVQITSGKIFVIGGGANYGESSEISEFNAERFNSQGIMRNLTTQSRWSEICNPGECRFGGTFKDSSGYGLYLEDSYVTANLVINGITYQGVYNSGEIIISRNTFQIPRITRTKGRMFFSAPFTMTGRMRVCRVSEAGVSCPPDKLLLNENITAHGTLRVAMRINSSYSQGRPVHFLRPISYEYKFEQ